MLRWTFLCALFAVIFTGCGDTHYYTEPVADPVADIFTPQPTPTHTVKHVVDHVVPPTEYNPFKNSLENVELTLDEFRDDLLLIVTMPGGPEIINVLGLNINSRTQGNSYLQFACVQSKDNATSSVCQSH